MRWSRELRPNEPLRWSAQSKKPAATARPPPGQGATLTPGGPKLPDLTPAAGRVRERPLLDTDPVQWKSHTEDTSDGPYGSQTQAP